MVKNSSDSSAFRFTLRTRKGTIALILISLVAFFPSGYVWLTFTRSGNLLYAFAMFMLVVVSGPAIVLGSISVYETYRLERT